MATMCLHNPSIHPPTVSAPHTPKQWQTAGYGLLNLRS
jgi:hypothetical protein